MSFVRWNRFLAATAGLLLGVWGAVAILTPHIPAPLVSPTPSNCDASLWQHVYNPQRLQVINPCQVVTGIIDETRVEADGDYHIRLKVDREYNYLLNARNISAQGGDLVLEPVCIHPVTQADAVSACQNYHSYLAIPKPGSHVITKGSYVLDKPHGWMELHPLTNITILP